MQSGTVPGCDVPECDVDLFDDEVLCDPRPVHARMCAVLLDAERSASGRGLGSNAGFDEVGSSSVVASDEPWSCPPRSSDSSAAGEATAPRTIE